jgi:hypothetical protein
MKIIVRTFVIALALTGAIATTYAKAPAANTKIAAVGKTSAMPVPTCPPSDPGDCGLSSW